MKRSLIVAAAALLACASHQRTSSAASAAEAEDRTSVVEPSSLSPEQVRMVQRSLIDRGFAVDLSGSFDRPTQTALGEFQRARGLPATGNLNASTLDALGIDPRDVVPVRGSDSSGHPSPQDSSPSPGSRTPSTTAPSGTANVPGSGTAAPATPVTPTPPPYDPTPKGSY